MSRTQRIAAVVYGAACYGIFFVTFLYLIGFVGNLVVPKSIDSGTAGGVASALVVNTLLLALFGVQHSVMARPGFKAVWTRIVPKAVERSTYVLASSLVLILLVVAWQPLPQAVWDVRSEPGRTALWAGYFLGYGVVLYSTLLIDHFDLFGLRQVVLYFRRRAYSEKSFVTPSLYRFIRHPLYVGWFVTFWVTPTMSVGHLFYAAAMTGYILIAIRYEERDLADLLGEPYRRWHARTPAFVPRIGAARPGAVKPQQVRS
jgi:protein-S-isoprenylcysteine O-methyltransferase Ste14